MDVSETLSVPQMPVSRQTVTVKTDSGPQDVEVVLAGVLAAIMISAKPHNQGAVMDKKV